MTNKRGFMSWIGLLLSFVGMAGLVLSILSLLPLNGYNIYTTTMTVLRLVEFEQDNGEFSQDAKLYLVFLGGSFFSSVMEMVATLAACCRRDTAETDQESCQTSHRKTSKSWFIRIICFTLLIQIIFSLFGTHLIYKLEKDAIPVDIQHNIFISCAILWINYLSLTVFSFILLFASFCILIGTSNQQKKSAQQDEETRPFILI